MKKIKCQYCEKNSTKKWLPKYKCGNHGFNTNLLLFFGSAYPVKNYLILKKIKKTTFFWGLFLKWSSIMMNIIQMKKIEKLVYWKVVLQSLMIFEILFLNKWFVFLQKDHKNFWSFLFVPTEVWFARTSCRKISNIFFFLLKKRNTMWKILAGNLLDSTLAKMNWKIFSEQYGKMNVIIVFVLIDLKGKWS